jgi:hypothetical protein
LATPPDPRKEAFATRAVEKTFCLRHDSIFLLLMRVLTGLLLAALLGSLLAGGWWMRTWTTKTSALPASGGLYFPRTILHDVPHFAQADDRWAGDLLGPTPDSLGATGCAVAAAAMVLASYGADLDPGALNRFLQEQSGYTERGWIYWEKAAEFPPVLAEHIYEDDASHFLIDWNLLRGNPVIVRLRFPDGITHFVVIVGKQGYEYLVRDPGPRYEDGIYHLSEFGSPIEALRFYRQLPKSTDT